MDVAFMMTRLYNASALMAPKFKDIVDAHMTISGEIVLDRVKRIQNGKWNHGQIVFMLSIMLVSTK